MDTRNTFSQLFFIKKHRLNSKEEAPIYLRITVNGKRTDMSMSRSIDINLWSTPYGMAIGNNKIVKDINKYLQSAQSTIYEHYKYLRETETIVTPTAIKNAFLGGQDGLFDRPVQSTNKSMSRTSLSLSIELSKDTGNIESWALSFPLMYFIH